MADFTNSKINEPIPVGSPFIPGRFLFKRVHAIRGTAVYNEFTEEWETESALCLAEVIPWPWSQDEFGNAFDQANLYGVRTRTYRLSPDDGGGDSDDHWYAVPKSLPSGYTSVNRAFIDISGISYGLNPDMTEGFIDVGYWNMRTATGFLFDQSTDLGINRGRWVPQAVSQFGELVTISGAVSWTLISGYWYAFFITNPYGHIGFRAGKMTITVANSVAGSADWEIIAYRVDRTLSSAAVIKSGTFSWASGGGVTATDFALGSVLPPEDGVRWEFAVRYQDPDIYPIGGTHTLELSPRTDVPLPYTATTKNYVAPGGYVTSVSAT